VECQTHNKKVAVKAKALTNNLQQVACLVISGKLSQLSSVKRVRNSSFWALKACYSCLLARAINIGLTASRRIVRRKAIRPIFESESGVSSFSEIVKCLLIIRLTRSAAAAYMTKTIKFGRHITQLSIDDQ